ncbi:AMP-binding protein [Xenorhabdus sp. IM139775]|uniref:AMP-binding protein n=1 Tax=Xenorhabdus sp. IM139775 TaxID=3025876 RepID=UPI0023582925|nr:AMP-binding protein [Xenorhabdus sp. IM139775]MDC9594961.1 AMP-binding protein [Xenorhabdus sp. IM139775]
MIPLSKIKEISSARGDRQALVFQGKIVNWNEYETIVEKLSNNLSKSIDISNVTSICYISPNRLELIYLASAAATLKLPCIGIDYTQTQNKIIEMIKMAGCGIIIVSSSYCIANNIDLKMLASVATILDIDSSLNHGLCYDNLEKISLEPIGNDISNKPFRSISFTSGTSGIPKAVIRTKSFDARRFSYFTARYGFNSEDRHLMAMPMYHAAGNGWARLFLQLGATIVIATPHDTKEMANLLRTEWISTSAMTPPLLNDILQKYQGLRIEPKENNLKFIIVGGKHFPPKTKLAAINTFGPNIYEYYGTTETGVNALAEPSDIISNPYSVGKAYHGNNIIVVDSKGHQIPSGQQGRIAISSYMNMDCYENAQSESIEVDGKEYLVTAETGYIDENGSVYLMNRSQGENEINVYELENEIGFFKEIKDVAVIVSDTSSNYVECGVVVNYGYEDNFDIIQLKIKSVMKDHKVKVKKICMLSHITYSPSGKVLAPKLIEMLSDENIYTLKSKKENTVKKHSDSNKSVMAFLIGVLCLVSTAIAWGGMFPIAKNALNTMDAVHISLIRYGIASLIFIVILALKEGIESLNPGKNFLKLWFFGTLGFAGFSILAFAGLAYTKAQHGAIIMSLMPLISVVMMWMMKGIKPAKFTLLSIIFALLGVILVITKGDITALTGGNLLPSLVILSGAFCWVTYTIGAIYVSEFSTLRYTAHSAFLGALSIVAIAWLTNSIGFTTIPSISQVFSITWELVYLITIAGVIAVFSWNTGIQRLGPVNGILFINLVPITAFAIGIIMDKPFTNAEVVGTLVTIGSLIINNIYIRGWFNRPNRKVLSKYR